MKCQQGAKTMNTTKNAIFIFSCIPFVLSAYSSYSAKTVLDTIAAESEMTITPSKAQNLKHKTRRTVLLLLMMHVIILLPSL